MEALLFALVAVRNGYRRQEAFVPEPSKFQSFDLQALTAEQMDPDST